MLRRTALPLLGIIMMAATACGRTPLTAATLVPPVRSSVATATTVAAIPTTGVLTDAQALQKLKSKLNVDSGQFYGAFGSEVRRVTVVQRVNVTKLRFTADLWAGDVNHMGFVKPERSVRVAGTLDLETGILTFSDRGTFTDRELWYFRVSS